MSDFDGGVAFLNAEGVLAISSDKPEFWKAILEKVDELRLAAKSDPDPVCSAPVS